MKTKKTLLPDDKLVINDIIKDISYGYDDDNTIAEMWDFDKGGSKSVEQLLEIGDKLGDSLAMYIVLEMQQVVLDVSGDKAIRQAAWKAMSKAEDKMHAVLKSIPVWD